MLKTTIIQVALFFLFSLASIVIGGVTMNYTKNDDLGCAIWLILQFLVIIYFIRKIIKLRRSTHQLNLPVQANKSKKSSKSVSNKPAPINKEIVIEYSDSESEVTSRKIRVKEIKYDQQKRKMVPYSLYAYCFLKKAPRTFLLNRIVSAHDTETGEIIHDIPNYLMK